MKTLLAPLLLVILSIGLFVWYINPQYANFNSLRSQSAALDVTLNQTTTLDQVLGGLVKKNNAITPTQLAELDTMVPDSISTVRLITEVDAIAARDNITLSSISVDDSASDNPGVSSTIGPNQGLFGSVDISFNLNASYGSFLTFLSDLEHSLRIIDIKSLTLSTTVSGPISNVNTVTPKNTYSYSIDAETYWLK